MKYQIELFEEEEYELFCELLNKFLLMLDADMVKDIKFDEKIVIKQSGEMVTIYLGLVIYLIE